MNNRRLTVIRADELLGADGLRQLSGTPSGRPTIIRNPRPPPTAPPPPAPPPPAPPPTTPAALRPATRAPAPPPAPPAPVITVPTAPSDRQVMVYFFVLAQVILGILSLLPAINREVAAALYPLFYQSDPALASAVYATYLDLALPVGAAVAVLGLTILCFTGFTRYYTAGMVAGLIYTLPLTALLVAIAGFVGLAILGLAIAVTTAIKLLSIFSK